MLDESIKLLINYLRYADDNSNKDNVLFDLITLNIDELWSLGSIGYEGLDYEQLDFNIFNEEGYHYGYFDEHYYYDNELVCEIEYRHHIIRGAKFTDYGVKLMKQEMNKVLNLIINLLKAYVGD
jgi:hypothetical protein